MVDSTLTHIYPILDRSGSMITCQADTEGGYNAYIAAQREQPGRCKVTLAQFDNDYEVVYAGVDIADVPALKLVPRGGTALLDAIGRTIIDAGRELDKLPEDQRPGAVIVPILTDGQENSSREFTREQVLAMIEQQTNTYSWLFTYLGANQDAISVGRGIGIAAGNSMTYHGANTSDVFSSLSTSTANFRSATAAGAGYQAAAASAAYSDEDRKNAVKPDAGQSAGKHPQDTQSGGGRRSRGTPASR